MFYKNNVIYKIINVLKRKFHCKKIKDWQLIFLLIFLALLLRIYRLSEQSIWLDEYLFIGLLPASSLRMHLLMARVLVPELCISPLYFILQYLWAHALDLSVPVLRLLPIFISMAGIPMVYYLGKSVGGRLPAFLASLLLAISPSHLWYAQELRPYTVVTVLCLISCYALLRASRENHYLWWMLNWIANALILWTYARSGLIFIIEGTFLLLFSRHNFRTLVIWVFFQFVSIAPWLFWTLKTPFVHTFHMDTSFLEIMNVIFWDDIINCHHDLLPPWKTNPLELLPLHTQVILGPRRIMDYSLGATLFLSGLYGGGCTVLLLWKKCTNALWSVRDIESLENYGLLFLLLIIPGSVLGLIEYVLRSPFVGSMYFMSDSISLYIFAALLIGKIPSFFGRTNIIVCIVILFAYQLCILLPHNTRTDYIGAAKLIRENATSNDSVMCLQWLAPENSLEYYLKDLQTPVKRITTLQGACDNAYEYFQLLSPTERSLHSVWCIIPFYFFQLIHSEEFARKSIENGLHERGLAYKTFLFPGHFNLVAYRINFAENISSPRHFKPVAMPFRFDEKRLINDLQISFNSQEQQEQTIYSLRHHLLSWPPIGSFIPFMDTLDLIDSGRFSLAKLMSNYTLNNSPNFGLAHYASGLVSIALKNKREASISFTRAYELHDGLQQLLGPATEDLLNGRITNALEHITLLEKQGDLYILRPLRSICGNMSK